MKARSTPSCLAMLFAVFLPLAGWAAQSDILGPTGSERFGSTVTKLPNGNFVVTDPNFDKTGPPVPDVGAVYLYSPDGTLISTLTGNSANDFVGLGGVSVLANGNYVVRSPHWDNGVATNAGAATWCSATIGVGPSAEVSATNSLVGSTANDGVGGDASIQGVVPLTNGHYLVVTPTWDNGVLVDAGAVTWCSGTSGIPSGAMGTGPVSALNSLVGASANDGVGSLVDPMFPGPPGANAVLALNNGNYVVASPNWDNGGISNAGAVTWGDGSTGTVGAVTSLNSLVGGTADDRVGSTSVGMMPGPDDFGLAALSNGNYVVCSPFWDNGVEADAGAITWGDGNAGVTGTVSSTNSLVGSTLDDRVGMDGVTALPNGNFVARNEFWDLPLIANVGAVTFVDVSMGVSGAISAGNSLVGTTPSDRVGSQPIVVLTNGNFVVCSPHWTNGSASEAGAVTWVDGDTGITGAVSDTNSLVGTATNDTVGSHGVTVLTNGHYVVKSADWDNGVAINVGAVTWGNGTTGITGNVTPANSLIGTTSFLHVDSGQFVSDRVGSGGVFALTNGNYVVCSPGWSNGTALRVGAATWSKGTNGITGVVSPSNSLVGSTGFFELSEFEFFCDFVGGNAVALPNGNYLVVSPSWDNGSARNAGAVTWCNGVTGNTGVVSPANSLVGGSFGDEVGIMPLTVLLNSNYVVRSPFWDNGGTSDAGAVTWGNGTTGVAGVVSGANSLVGTSENDMVGSFPMFSLANGNYVVNSPSWDNGALSDVGAVTWGNGVTGTAGPVTPANSLVGSQDSDLVGSYGIFPQTDGRYIVHSGNWTNGAIAFAGAVTLGAANGPTTGPITATNSVRGNNAGWGPPMVFFYDAVRAQMVVGRPGDNVVTRFGNVGTVAFGSALFTFNEGATMLTVPVIRSSGTHSAVSVNVSSSSVGGTATAGTDYTIINQILNFPAGVTTQEVGILITDDSILNEPNETFKLTLSGGNAALGNPSTTTVRIIDNDTPDNTPPSKPTFTLPAAGAQVGVNPGASFTVTGMATDNKGIASVEAQLNGGFFVPATLTTVTGSSATWSVTFVPITGINTVVVRCTDTSGNPSPGLPHPSRSFVIMRPLVVKTLGNGTISPAGFVPTSFRPVGKFLSITALPAATPAPGFLFAGWSLNGGANITQQIGISPAALDRVTLNCIFKEGLQITANFVPNPYTSQVAGVFDGAITANPTLPDRAPSGPGAEDGTAPNSATEGSVKLTVMSSGAFSGTLNIDGLSLGVGGVFDHTGKARFGTSRLLTLSVPRMGKTSLLVAFQTTLTPLTAQITGTITQHDADPLNPVAVSNVVARRASFNGTTLLVPPQFLGPSNANGVYTTILAARGLATQPPGFALEDYPRGDGVAMITLTKAGMVTVVGNLADGTPLGATTSLSQSFTFRLFSALYNKQGIYAANVTLNTAPPTSDLTAPEGLWCRPIMDSQYYPDGWEEGVKTDVTGAKYVVNSGFSVIPGLPFPDGDGNANLSFTDGNLVLPLPPPRTVTIDGNDLVTKTPADPSFTLSVNRTTARITGTFTHNLDGSKPVFVGMVFQKGVNRGTYGYFLTVPPTVKDYLGKSGRATLIGQ